MPLLCERSLSILDLGVFYAEQRMESYFADGYFETFGENHSGLSKPEIVNLIRDLEVNGLLTLKHVPDELNESGPIVSVTPLGFSCWNQHRRPDWKKYVSTASSQGSNVRSFFGFDHSTCWAAFQHSMKFGEIGTQIVNLKSWHGKEFIFFAERPTYTIEFEEDKKNEFDHAMESTWWSTRPYWNRLGDIIQRDGSKETSF